MVANCVFIAVSRRVRGPRTGPASTTFRRPGPAFIRGTTERRHGYPVRRPGRRRDTAPMAAPGVPSRPDAGLFVGRRAELEQRRTRIRGARSGSGGLVLLGGPAGIGKTRTVEEAVQVAPTVVWGRSVDDPGAPPLWPWRRVLRSLPEAATAVAEALGEVDLRRERAADPAAARFRFVATAT